MVSSLSPFLERRSSRFLPLNLVFTFWCGSGCSLLFSDNSDIHWRASALGVYRLWRDSGYAVGALGAGFIADQIGVDGALSVTAVVLVAACALFSLGAQKTHS